jgi:hypothetical protein
MAFDRFVQHVFDGFVFVIERTLAVAERAVDARAQFGERPLHREQIARRDAVDSGDVVTVIDVAAASDARLVRVGRQVVAVVADKEPDPAVGVFEREAPAAGMGDRIAGGLGRGRHRRMRVFPFVDEGGEPVPK